LVWPHVTPVADDVVVHAHGSIDRQCKSDALRSAVLRRDHGVDADHFAADVQQRTAAVARIDGGVGLNKALELRPDLFPARRAHNSGRHRLLQAEGRADRHGPVAHLDSIGVADRHRRQRRPGIDLDDRNIALAVRADQPRAVFRRVAIQSHANMIHILDHVIVGDDVAVLIDDEAGSRLLPAQRLRRGRLLRAVIKEVAEQIGAVVVAVFILVLLLLSAAASRLYLRGEVRRDVHHARPQHLGELGKLASGLGRARDHQRRRIRRNVLTSGRVHARVDHGPDDNA
jgi:hypothetical protein